MIFSSAITIAVLTQLSFDNMTLFRYDGKKVKDLGFTGRCYLKDIMSDNIFQGSMRQEIRFFLSMLLLLLLLVDTSTFFEI